jgi:hypothetical protein
MVVSQDLTRERLAASVLTRITLKLRERVRTKAIITKSFCHVRCAVQWCGVQWLLGKTSRLITRSLITVNTRPFSFFIRGEVRVVGKVGNAETMIQFWAS